MATTNKNEPIYSFDVEVPDGEVKASYRIQVRKPTRSMVNEAELFYAVKYSEFVKIGLLTAQQVAKRQIDMGGIFTEEQQKTYGKLQSLLFEKREMLMRLLGKDPTSLSDDEQDRKKELSADVAIIQNQLSDFEAAKNAAYEHTADALARKEVLNWLGLSLTRFGKIKPDSEEVEFSNMFKGEDHKTRLASYEELEDNQDAVLASSVTTISSVIALWYWHGITDKQVIKETIEAANAAAPKP